MKATGSATPARCRLRRESRGRGRLGRRHGRGRRRAHAARRAERRCRRRRRLALGAALAAERFGAEAEPLAPGSLGDLAVRRNGAVRHVVVGGRVVVENGFWRRLTTNPLRPGARRSDAPVVAHGDDLKSAERKDLGAGGAGPRLAGRRRHAGVGTGRPRRNAASRGSPCIRCISSVDHIGEAVHADRRIRTIQFAGAAACALLGDDPIDHALRSNACVRPPLGAGRSAYGRAHARPQGEPILEPSSPFHNRPIDREIAAAAFPAPFAAIAWQIGKRRPAPLRRASPFAAFVAPSIGSSG